jgi:two-component system KDP operon response regulator KdpE
VGEGGIDLVLLDLGLPDMDGHDLMRQLLRQEPAPQVIVVSADARSDIVAQVLDAGAFACLGKPFDIEKLRELVSRVLLGGGTS